MNLCTFRLMVLGLIVSGFMVLGFYGVWFRLILGGYGFMYLGLCF